MTPYRQPSQRSRDPSFGAWLQEDIVLWAAITILGGIRVALALLDHEVFGAEATIALAMLIGGIAAFAFGGRPRRRAARR